MPDTQTEEWIDTFDVGIRARLYGVDEPIVILWGTGTTLVMSIAELLLNLDEAETDEYPYEISAAYIREGKFLIPAAVTTNTNADGRTVTVEVTSRGRSIAKGTYTR